MLGSRITSKEGLLNTFLTVKMEEDHLPGNITAII